MWQVPADVAKTGYAVKESGITNIHSLLQGDLAQLHKQLKAANTKNARLEQQLIQAGIAPAEVIPHEEAKDRIAQMGQRLMEFGGNDVEHADPAEQPRLRKEYHELTLEMEKVDAALVLTPEYQQEQQANEEGWERKHAEGNEQAIRKIRRHDAHGKESGSSSTKKGCT
jgi:type I site-specific restriction endonuclease